MTAHADSWPLTPQVPQRIEQDMLAAMLHPKTGTDPLLDRLQADHFYHPPHRLIFSAWDEVRRPHQPVDIEALYRCLEQHDHLDLAGGILYLAEITALPVVAAWLGQRFEYLDQVRCQRQQQQLALEQLAALEQGPLPPAAVADYTRRWYEQAAPPERAHGFMALAESLPQTRSRIEALAASGRSLLGLATGLPSLDRVCYGLQKGELVILAGQTSMGKTMLALQLAMHVVRHEQIGVGYFSLEMAGTQLDVRLFSRALELPYDRIGRGQLSAAEWDEYTAQEAAMAAWPLWHRSGGVSLDQAGAAMRALMAEQSIGLWVFDYLQLLQQAGDSEYERISRISTGLKGLALELDVPILALAQLNRDYKYRKDKQPELSDLRGSGSIEQDADQVWMLHRPGYYHQNDRQQQPIDATLALLLIRKNRNGPTGAVELIWRPDTFCLAEAAPSWRRPPAEQRIYAPDDDPF